MWEPVRVCADTKGVFVHAIKMCGELQVRLH